MKKLLLLGLLRGQELHGYGLVEYLNSHATGGAGIGKSNAYRLLRMMEKEGLITSRAERDGRRPERHVYEITAAGEAYFQDQLVNSLAEDATAEQPGVAVLNYLPEVDPATAARQLKKRRDQVALRHAGLGGGSGRSPGSASCARSEPAADRGGARVAGSEAGRTPAAGERMNLPSESKDAGAKFPAKLGRHAKWLLPVGILAGAYAIAVVIRNAGPQPEVINPGAPVHGRQGRVCPAGGRATHGG